MAHTQTLAARADVRASGVKSQLVQTVHRVLLVGAKVLNQQKQQVQTR